MTYHKLTVIIILLLTLSFNGMAQNQIALEINPKAPKPEKVKIERINNQDMLRVASLTDTIRILWSEENKSIIETMMQSNVGATASLKDIDGADIHILRIKKNMKLGIYFRNKMRTAVSVTDEELSILTSSND